MRTFTKDSKMYELVHNNYHLLPVMNRFGITLGFKDKKVETVCNEKGIDINFFLIIVNTFHSDTFFPEDELKTFSPLLIIDYLVKTHKYYVEYVLPKLENLLDRMIDSSPENSNELFLIESFYKKYRDELVQHFRDEEEKTFPYASEIYLNKNSSFDYTIHTYEKEHDNVEEKLNDLKNLIIRHVKPVYDSNLCNEFLITLLRFERDIHNHSRIEDKILVPQIEEIEKGLHA